MAEYIERAKAKEELLSWARCIKHPEHLMTEDAMCVLDGIPAADVVEVVHGRWIRTTTIDYDWGGTYHKWTCSVCGYYTGENPSGTNYCPNCGARMGDS